MARKPASMYRRLKGQAFTRRQYTEVYQTIEFTLLHMGNRKKAEAGGFPVGAILQADNLCQIQDKALEAARQVANARIRGAAGENYALRMHTYPHWVFQKISKQQVQVQIVSPKE